MSYKTLDDTIDALFDAVADRRVLVEARWNVEARLAAANRIIAKNSAAAVRIGARLLEVKRIADRRRVDAAKLRRAVDGAIEEFTR